MQTVDSKFNIREDIIIFWRSQNTVHAIGYKSRLARKVARSTSTAKSLAAAGVVDRFTYFQHLL